MHKTIDYFMLAGYDVISQYIGLHSDISLFPTHTADHALVYLSTGQHVFCGNSPFLTSLAVT